MWRVLAFLPCSQYERTAFFDGIIERGLRDGTRFNIDHVTTEEKSKLGITMDRTSGKFYLAAYGSPKARRNSTRRGSQTSSDGDAADHQHAVIKEVSDFLAAEIEAAGEHAEVHLLKARTDPGSSRGSHIVNFSVSIRRRASGAGVGADAGRGRGDGEGPVSSVAHTQTADAGGGKPASAAATTASRRKGGASSVSVASDGSARQSKSGSSPRPQTNRRDGMSSVQGPQAPKPRGRPVSLGGGTSEGRGPGFAVQEGPKRRKSVTHTVFSAAPKIGTPGVAKQESRVGIAKVDMSFGDPMPTDARPRPPVPMVGNPSAQTASFLPGRVPTLVQPHQHLPPTSTAGQYGVATYPRGQGFSPTCGFTGLTGNYPQRLGVTVGTPAPVQATAGGGGRVPAMSVSSAPALSSWQLHPTVTMRSDEFGAQTVARTTSGRATDTRVEATGTTTPGVGGSIPSLSQQQQLTGGTTFGHRSPTQTLTSLTPGTLLPSDAHAPISTLSAYTAHVRQQSQAQQGAGGSTHGGWGTTTRMASSMECGREPDEEDMDFLASFF